MLVLLEVKKEESLVATVVNVGYVNRIAYSEAVIMASLDVLQVGERLYQILKYRTYKMFDETLTIESRLFISRIKFINDSFHIVHARSDPERIHSS
jgi:hypothetical protein